MKTSRFATLAAIFALLASPLYTSIAATLITVEEYNITLHLQVPRIYNNSNSLGKRQYQSQTLKGTLLAIYDENDPYLPLLHFTSLSNITHKINGSPITYSTTTDPSAWSLIGDNAKNRFKTASVAFTIDADPSYNIGPDDPDNTLILTLAGYGSYKRLHGTASGQIGCGCREYGHISPTRIMRPHATTGEVSDIAAVSGRWSASLVRSYSFSLNPQVEEP